MIAESVSLWSRYQRCQQAWRPHLDNCKAAIMEAAERCPRRRTALILGSGLLYDIPILPLSQMFERVILVDTAHLLPVRWQLRTFDNVALVTEDITGMYGDAHQNPAVLLNSQPFPPVTLLHDDDSIDLVISANMLSQLALLPLKWLRKHSRRTSPLTDTDISRINACFVEQHLHYLQKFQCPCLLITDVARQRIAHNHTVIEASELIDTTLLPSPHQQWQWDIAPIPELNKHWSQQHIVQSTFIS